MPHPITRYRKAKQVTQEALAKRLGVTGVTVSRWETGERLIGRSLLPLVCRVTGISPRELRPDWAKLMGEAAE